MNSKRTGWKTDQRLKQGLGALVSIVIAVTGLMVEAQTGAKEKSKSSSPVSSGTELCGEWTGATEVGRLDTKLIDEESGLAVSRDFPVLYHINDSGDGAHLYVTGRDGSNTQKIAVKGGKPTDTEDLSFGPCPTGNGKCIAIADIGDNAERRKQIEIVFIEEKHPMPEAVEPVLRVALRYPDRAHNAEAFAVMPDGDLVIVTKEVKGQRNEAQPAQVFRLRKSLLSVAGKDPAVLEKIGEIDIPSIVKDKSYGGRVTGMSVSSDAKRFLLMTYDKVLEFQLDLGGDALPSKLQEGRDYSIVNVTRLMQQESVAYDTNDKDFFYTSEVERKILGADAPAPLMVMKCNK